MGLVKSVIMLHVTSVKDRSAIPGGAEGDTDDPGGAFLNSPNNAYVSWLSMLFTDGIIVVVQGNVF